MSAPRRRHAPPVERARRCRGDDGAAVAEFCLLLPVLMSVVFATLEAGLLFRQQTQYAMDVQTAARTGARLGKDPNADRLLLSSLATATVGNARTTITKVAVYDATGFDNGIYPDCFAVAAPATPGGGIPAITPPTGAPVNCNVYSFDQLVAAATTAKFSTGTGGSCGASDWDKNWCPATQRLVAIQTAQFLGVYVEANYQMITQFFGAGPRKLTEHALFKIEALQ